MMSDEGVLPMMSDEGVLPTGHVQLPSSLPDQPGEAITDPRRLNGARLASRRSDRCKLSLIAALIALVQHDWTLLNSLSPYTKLAGYFIKCVLTSAEYYDSEGWLCPALFKYFKAAPKEIYVRAEGQ